MHELFRSRTMLKEKNNNNIIVCDIQGSLPLCPLLVGRDTDNFAVALPLTMSIKNSMVHPENTMNVT